MERSQRMEPLSQLTGDREREAAKELGESQRLLADRERQLEQLIDYRNEYAQRFQSTGETGLDGVRLRDYRVFLGRLSQAIVQQRTLVDLARSEVDRARDAWLSARTRSKAVDTVVQRYRAEEQRVDERRQQSLLDEHALRRPPSLD